MSTHLVLASPGTQVMKAPFLVPVTSFAQEVLPSAGLFCPLGSLSELLSTMRPAGMVPEPTRISPGRPRQLPAVSCGQSVEVGS